MSNIKKNIVIGKKAPSSLIAEKIEVKLNDARIAEKSAEYFTAAFLYRDILKLSLKKNDSKIIKLCKKKVVEMNKKSIAYDKCWNKFPIELKLSKDEEIFVKKILKQKNLKTILQIIGNIPCFSPDADKIKRSSIPVSFQITDLSNISQGGHILRGGADSDKAWFMTIYNLEQQRITHLFIGRIIYELMKKTSDKNKQLTIEELSEYFSNANIFEEKNLKLILIGLKRYFENDYVSAMHILVPQFESTFLRISEKCGIDIIALDQKQGIATRTKTLSETYLDSEEFKNVWGNNLCQQIKFILFDQMGYRIRHKVAHGEIEYDECNFSNTTIIIYLYLVLLGRVHKK